MKIAVISSNPAQLKQIGAILLGDLHQVALVDADMRTLQQVAEQEKPDLMLIDGICCTPAALGEVEQATARFPRIAIVLLCASAAPDFLISAMRAGVREVLPSPIAAGALEAAVNRIGAKLQGERPRAGGKVLAFIACKGGSGATFLATNLGRQLADAGAVLLIDLNLQFGDALSFVHEGRPATTLADVARDIGRLDASFLAACAVKIAPNFAILAAPDDPAQASDVTSEQVAAIIDMAAAEYAFVVLDLGRPVDALDVQALDRADMIYPVMQADLPSLRNAKKMLSILGSLGYARDKIELIINRYDKGGAIDVAAIEKALGKYAVHTVANSYRPISASVNRAEALIDSAPRNPVARTLAELARALSPGQVPVRGMFARLLRRNDA